jgi:ketosteroid isomerase-like protein
MPPIDSASGRVEDRQQLRTLLEAMEKNISALDIEEVLKLMQPDAIVTWQNAEVSRGADQIRAYYNRMIKGSAPIVKKFSTKATLGGPAVFYSDSAIAYGTTVDTYDLASGLHFTLNANWSTTVVKTNGQWKVAALHFSTDLFDNPLLNNAERLAWIAGGGGLVAGLLLAFAVMRMRRKKSAT